jgi:hypothetical protein
MGLWKGRVVGILSFGMRGENSSLIAEFLGRSFADDGDYVVDLDMINHFKFDRTRSYRIESGLCCFMLEMEFRIFRRRGRRICCLRRRDMVFITVGDVVLGGFTDKYPDLVTYCEREKVPFTTFRNFGEILRTVKGIVGGDTSVEEVMANRT